MSEEKKTYPLEMKKKLHEEVKVQSAREDKTMKEMMLDAIREYLKTHKVKKG